ncbi:MAG: hypothetical protein ABFS14_12910 [Gemmatimonadota bacterium]
MDFDTPQDEYQQIENRIASDDSPVGIDAKETHIIIIGKLLEIERRLDRIESRLG